MTAKNFFLDDWSRTLFPMWTERILIEHAEEDLRTHVYTEILGGGAQHFLPQEPVYAAKPNWHLRRTSKLDPAATWYLYDLVHRNRGLFRRPFSPKRLNFGYRFQGGEPISGTAAYGEFRETIAAWRTEYPRCVSFDVASYFNTVYHHDLVHWFGGHGASQADAEGFGRFLREINAGRSVDCLPQGLYPTKMLGNAFLVSIDNASRLRSTAIARFMDDFYLFDADEGVLREDFLLVQRLLGARGLNLNPKKTRLFEAGDEVSALHGKVDEIKVRLLRQRREQMRVSTGPFDEPPAEDAAEPEPLAEEDREFLLSLLQGDSLEEDDAELVLSLMGEHSEDVLEYLGAIIERFPNLAKRLFYFCDHVQDQTALADLIGDLLRDRRITTEFQLFWLAWIVEKYLLGTSRAGDLLLGLFEAEAATVVSKAKVLEVAERRWGMGDLREEQLRTGQSGWLAWAAAVGTRCEQPAVRNHLLGYAANGSRMNRLITSCVSGLA